MEQSSMYQCILMGDENRLTPLVVFDEVGRVQLHVLLIAHRPIGSKAWLRLAQRCVKAAIEERGRW